jgi:endo-1,4-beta-xylanase
MNMTLSRGKKIPVIYCICAIVTLIASGESTAREKFFGCIWKWSSASAAPASFTRIFDQATPENAGKWGSAEPSRGNFNWTTLDAMYQWADNNNALVKHHCFVWGSAQPGWLSGYTNPDTVKRIMTTWITTYLKHYGPKIDMIDVVNEPLHAKPSYRDYLGGDGATGWDWVIWVFQTARDSAQKYAPSAKLLINEYWIVQFNDKTTEYLKIINLLKDRNLIDGIGEQGHNYEGLDTAYAHRNLDRLAATGLPIYISELDVRGNDADQLAIYKRIFPLFWNYPAVKGVRSGGIKKGSIGVPKPFSNIRMGPTGRHSPG